MTELFAAKFITGIDANRTIKDELAEAARRQRGRRRISVTDLVNPRQSFFRWTHPEIRPSPDRLQLMLSGTGFHDLFGKAISTEEFVEQFVELDGIVGKIDIYEDVPTELKTTGSIPADVLASRPGYIDQLGMYCAMVGKQRGRLLLYKRAQYGRKPELKAFDVEYTDAAAIAGEMRSRRALLEAAIASKDPAGLLQCEWFNLTCDYKHICGCDQVNPCGRVVARGAARVAPNDQLSASFAAQLDRAPQQPAGFALNDLVFPRKTAFERRSAGDEDDSGQDGRIDSLLAGMERQGFLGALRQAIYFGAPDNFARLPLALRSLKGWVSTYKGLPMLLRSSKMRQMLERERLAEFLSHLFDRLAFECALTRHERGRLILYYEALKDDKFMVYDVWFKNLEAIAAEADRRLALLEAGAPPEQLPACPPWMAKFCRFAPGCGCGS